MKYSNLRRYQTDAETDRHGGARGGEQIQILRRACTVYKSDADKMCSLGMGRHTKVIFFINRTTKISSSFFSTIILYIFFMNL